MMSETRTNNNWLFKMLWTIPFFYSLRFGNVNCVSRHENYDSGSVTIAMKDHACIGNDVIRNVITGNAIVCAAECTASETCLGYFYHSGNHLCVTCNTWYDDVSDLGSHSGMVYFRHDKVPGTWTSWTDGSSCSKTCGDGVKTRTRTCDMTVYGAYTEACVGSPSGEVPCHTFSCTPLATSCADWASRGLTVSTDADIDPDGIGTEFGPLVVPCDLDSEPGKAITVLHHNVEDPILVSGHEVCGSYSVPLVYDVGFPAAARIADGSTACRQYVKWECLGTVFSPCIWWNNRSDAKSTYFTGPYSSGAYCQCGHYGTCNDESDCECDSNDEVWRLDDGYVTDKDDLPIYSFSAGDTGDPSERGKHTIGPVYCW